MDLTRELQISIEAVRKASIAIMDVYTSSEFGVEIKEDNSPVTKADKAADEIIRGFLGSAFPNYGLLTEESVDSFSRLEKDYVFIVDPVDGTKEFVAKSDEFTINIGLSYKHRPVLGVIMIPCTGEIYYGVEGLGSFYLKDENSKPVQIHCSDATKDLIVLTSRCHFNEKEQALIDKHKDVIKEVKPLGATIKGCAIASGKAHMSYRVSSNTKEWDTCAMQAIVEQAGGCILKYDGTPIVYNREDVYNRDGYVVCNRKENFLI